jgi:uncharacterized protein
MTRQSAPSNRRKFLQTGLTAGLAWTALADSLLAAQDDSPGVSHRPLGKTGQKISILGLGGWHIAKAAKDAGEATAIRIMHEAIDNGLNFFDNSWDYHDGYAEELMGRAVLDRRDRVFLMTKNCERDYKGAMACLDDSLRRLQTDCIDLWQFHEINYDNDPDWVFDRGGLRAALEAQKAGKVRFIGFTGHKDPRFFLSMLAKPYVWASSQMPINVCDWFFRSFTKQVIPVCLEKGTGVIGMKCLGGSPDGQNARLARIGLATGDELLRYALSLPVCSVVTGIRTQADLEQSLRVGREFQPMTDEQLTEFRNRFREVAGDGRHELFKTQTLFDGGHHRRQHGLH